MNILEINKKAPHSLPLNYFVNKMAGYVKIRVIALVSSLWGHVYLFLSLIICKSVFLLYGEALPSI